MTEHNGVERSKTEPAERLCELLDERDIKWHRSNGEHGMVIWERDGLTYSAANAWPRNDGTRTKLVLHVSYPTPEQAIAATVGTCTDLSKRLREVTGLRSFAELFGFDWHDGSDWDWHDVACAMADAIDATVCAHSLNNQKVSDKVSDYTIDFAESFTRPPETMVGECVYDEDGNHVGWITAATVGAGTCKAIDTGYATAKCSECDAEFMGSIMTNEPPDYVKPLERCPRCGRRIIEEETE